MGDGKGRMCPQAEVHSAMMRGQGISGTGIPQLYRGSGPEPQVTTPFLQFLSAMQSSLGPESSSAFPSVPVSVPVSDPSSGLSGPHLLSKKGALQPRASQRHRGSVQGQGPPPPDSPQHVSSSTHPCWAKGSAGRWRQCVASGTLGEQDRRKQGRCGRSRTGSSSRLGGGCRNGRCGRKR